MFAQFSRFNGGLADELLHFTWKQVSVWVNAKACRGFNRLQAELGKRAVQPGSKPFFTSKMTVGFTF
jgi:hypothetical protein